MDAGEGVPAKLERLLLLRQGDGDLVAAALLLHRCHHLRDELIMCMTLKGCPMLFWLWMLDSLRTRCRWEVQYTYCAVACSLGVVVGGRDCVPFGSAEDGAASACRRAVCWPRSCL